MERSGSKSGGNIQREEESDTVIQALPNGDENIEKGQTISAVADNGGQKVESDPDLVSAPILLLFVHRKGSLGLTTTQVTWDGPEDAANPRNWPIRRRWVVTVLISFFNVVGPLSSSIVAPAIPTMKSDLHTSDTVATMILSIYMLAFSFGPLITSPLSEMYGRLPVLQGGNAFFLVFNTACGFAKTPAQILSFRFLSGMGGCASQSVSLLTNSSFFLFFLLRFPIFEDINRVLIHY